MGHRPAQVVRYIEPLREGGSLPGLVELEDGRLVVVKLRGAGQGPAALVAELLVGRLAQQLGLPIPEVELVELPEALTRTERDEEVRELLQKSVGLNVALQLLPRALNFDAAATVRVDSSLAAQIVAFDAYVMNVDRTARNPNLMWSQGKLWLIDHGAALYWHHGWDGVVRDPDRAFPHIANHVLLAHADDVGAAGHELLAGLTDTKLIAVTSELPDAWLGEPSRRAAYVQHLAQRRNGAATFLAAAQEARARV